MRHGLFIGGFLVSIAMMAMIGIYVLHTNQRIITTFAEKEDHFTTVIMAATEVSSFAKRAEGHLLLYLLLQRADDKEKFPMRVESLFEQMAILDQSLENPEARAILDKIKINAGDILSDGNTLLENHDQAMVESDEFVIERYKEEVFTIHEKLSEIRALGVELVTVEVQLENNIEIMISKNASRLRFYLSVLITLFLGFTLYLGWRIQI